jgi:hypothetical protein
MRLGELPALTSAVRARVSMKPSMITRPGKAVGLDTLWEASTRVVPPLGGFVAELEEPQESKLILARPRTITRTTLFKRDAPNDMKD